MHDPACQRLLQITGVGITTATAAVARVGNIHHFPRDHSFASWLGLTAREYSSRQTRRLGQLVDASHQG
jgi:transposase